MLSFKHDLQREYAENITMSTLCQEILQLSPPSRVDLVHQIEVLKSQDAIFRDIKDIYAFMFKCFKKTEANWKFIS